MADIVFNKAILNSMNGNINLSTDAIKCILLTGAPIATWENLAHVTNELAAGDGYTAGGVAVACTLVEASGVLTFDSADPSWNPITASGLLHAVWYSDTSTDKKLICSKDFGGAKSVTNNEFRINVDAAGLFTIP